MIAFGDETPDFQRRMPGIEMPDGQADGDHIHQGQAGLCKPLVVEHDLFVMPPQHSRGEDDNQSEHDEAENCPLMPECEVDSHVNISR